MYKKSIIPVCHKADNSVLKRNFLFTVMASILGYIYDTTTTTLFDVRIRFVNHASSIRSSILSAKIDRAGLQPVYHEHKTSNVPLSYSSAVHTSALVTL